MKTKLILTTMGLFILMASLFVLSSCTKNPNENLTKDKQDTSLQASPIDEKDLAETDEDLLTVDYKEFYDQLAPHGEWIQVPPEEIGLKPMTDLRESSGNKNFTLSNLMGIKDAYASTASVGLVYAWKPSADLGVTMVAGETPVYVPYSNGQWVNTDAGWYFKAPTPVEETVSHYGRWVNTPAAGWMWVPGRVWSPAWVDWKQNDTYVSWAPLPPSVYLNNGTMSIPIIDNNNYTIVDRNYFLEPNVYKYSDVYYDDGSRILVNGFTGIPGVTVVNSSIINRGPDVSIFQTIYGRNIELVKINHVKNFKDVRYSALEYNVYTPVFTKYKNKGNDKFTINEPKSFKKYDEWKVTKENKGNDNGNKNKGNDNGNINKGNDNGNKGNDNGNKNKGNENVNKNKGNDNGNKNKGNDNGNKNKGNDNGNKNKGNDNGNKNKGNDNGNKNKGNDNGNKNKGNDNGAKNKGNDNGNKNKGNDNGKGKNNKLNNI